MSALGLGKAENTQNELWYDYQPSGVATRHRTGAPRNLPGQGLCFRGGAFCCSTPDTGAVTLQLHAWSGLGSYQTMSKSVGCDQRGAHPRQRTRISNSSRCMFAVVQCLILLTVCSCVKASIEDEFIAASSELRNQVPDRLVFNQEDLAQCLADSSAKNCVLRGPIKIDPDAWRARFAATNGTAVLTAEHHNITISSEPCYDCQESHQASDALGNIINIPKVQEIDWNWMAGVIGMGPGTRLRLSNLNLGSFAYKEAYKYSSATPYRAIGVGLSIFPTFNLAPNARFVGLNLTSTFVNPSDTDDCPRYVEKSLSYLVQSFGVDNITVINQRSILITGPIIINVPIEDGRTGARAGNATSVYKFLTTTCLDKSPAAPGEAASTLPAVMAAPVAVSVALVAGLVLWWWCMRRRRLNSGRLHADLEGDAEKGDMPEATYNDLGPHEAILQERAYAWGYSASTPFKSDSAAGAPDQHQPYFLGRHSAISSARGSLDKGRHSAISSARGSFDMGRHSATSSARASLDKACAALPAYPSGASQAAQGTPTPDTHSSQPAAVLTGRGAASSSYSPNMSRYSSGNGSTTPPGAASLSAQQLCTGLRNSGLGKVDRAGDGCTDTTPAVLKARSDASVLKDIRLGPLLGQGCYGRVYRGRWKATPVAVKIIDHYSTGGGGSGDSHGNRLSAGREMLFATSIAHPNLVTTFHISTLSSSQRIAAANSQPLAASTVDSTVGQQVVRRLSSSSINSSSSCSSEQPPELVQTWIVMEYCPKGSLEQAVKLGKLKLPDGQPDMVGIYKALLDTASGLDYLHSIGVVHGDLKTANVLLKGGKEQRGVSCKITDFGLSRVLDMNASHISTGTHGTIVYMPKELLLTGRMTQATDVYSFGLMMWELFSSQRIMDSDEGLSIGQMFYMIAYQDWRPEVPRDCPQGYIELMTSCWHEDPEQRPTAQQLLRRLQKLQGQTRQESLAARKMGSLQRSSLQPGESQRLYSDSIPGGSETGQLQLPSTPTQQDSTDNLQSGLSAEQLYAVGPASGSGQVLIPFLAAPCYCAVCDTVTPADGVVEHSAAASSSLHGAYALHAAQNADATSVGIDAGRSATIVPVMPEEHWSGQFTALTAHGSLQHLVMQLQSEPASRVCAGVGFVSPYGEEFVGCLPDLPSSDDGSGDDIHSSYQPYIAALEAASASRAVPTAVQSQEQLQ